MSYCPGCGVGQGERHIDGCSESGVRRIGRVDLSTKTLVDWLRLPAGHKITAVTQDETDRVNGIIGVTVEGPTMPLHSVNGPIRRVRGQLSFSVFGELSKFEVVDE